MDEKMRQKMEIIKIRVFTERNGKAILYMFQLENLKIQEDFRYERYHERNDNRGDPADKP